MSLPEEPYSRIERYLAKLAGQEVDIPDKPITRIECYLDYIVNNGGGVPAANAGAHNAVFRGQSLGTSFTSAQSAAIVAGTFDGLYVGDYWTINNVVWRIAGLDLYLTTGDTKMTAHHAVIVPDSTLYAQTMNAEATTAGGYAGTALHTEGLVTALESIISAFGDTHVLTRRALLTTGLTTRSWSDTRVDIMTESQVLGRGSYATQSQSGINLGERPTQMPLFAMAPQYIMAQGWYWLQDIVNATSFSRVSVDGATTTANATSSGGVRPYFCIA